MKITYKYGILFSVFIYVLSMFFPAFYIDRLDYFAWSSGIGLLFFGWVGALSGGAALAWFANPILFISWICALKKYKKTSLLLSILAFGIGLSFFYIDTVISSEAPTYSKITHYKSGYWLWLASMLSFSIINIFNIIINLKTKND